MKEEKEENTARLVQQLFADRLNCLNVVISKAFRMGKQSNRDRLILVMMESYKDKSVVMHNKRNLKGSKIFLQNDRTPEQRENMKILWKRCRQGSRVRDPTLRMMNYL